MHPFHVLGFLQTAFMIWMLVDAVKRRVEFYWYIIIFFPFGEWVYFFAVKIHDFRQVRFRLAERAPSLRKLRFEAKQTPSINNKLALADGLYDSGEHAEAVELFGEVLRQDETNRGALHGSGLCKLRLEDYAGAAADLRRVVEQQPSFRDYRPWLDLAETLWLDDRRDEAIEALRGLLKNSPRMDHRVALAQRLLEAGEYAEARELLEQVVEESEHAPHHQRRLMRQAIRTARRLLKEVKPGRAST
jgi:hypothetical protein